MDLSRILRDRQGQLQEYACLLRIEELSGDETVLGVVDFGVLGRRTRHHAGGANDSDAVLEYGYVENLTQYSSISRQATLDTRCATDLANSANVKWEPEITLLGRQTPPSPTADYGLWIGDSINIINEADETEQTSGRFRINILDVKVSGTNAETIRPTLERLI